MEKVWLGVGALISFAYLGFWAFVLHGARWTSLASTMPGNEIGDFLGGAFGPLIFLWLVLGFIQQRIEDRNR
ncbi:hypothetical protein [Ramlibacter tataouinensis]|uniref:Candidate membrane protein n=1 Tax=Ramlibacter tataouinensis (strain ATCC BAA-407 / DSM 14655 / LMG 21543 / TTB310) TaxID=365046 RepID=F5Y435_RAMTT|nr:hypothetical protein [Ramlibacter tataouinensis]AEG92500.1 hypothetical protein Rta_14130 [Ramlibacter tataouinensis TTB310]